MLTSTASAAERGKTGKDSEQSRGRSVTGGEWKPCMPSASPSMTWSSLLSSATGAATPLAPQVSHTTFYGLVCDKVLAKADQCYVSLFTAPAHRSPAHRTPAHCSSAHRSCTLLLLTAPAHRSLHTAPAHRSCSPLLLIAPAHRSPLLCVHCYVSLLTAVLLLQVALTCPSRQCSQPSSQIMWHPCSTLQTSSLSSPKSWPSSQSPSRSSRLACIQTPPPMPFSSLPPQLWRLEELPVLQQWAVLPGALPQLQPLMVSLLQ